MPSHVIVVPSVETKMGGDGAKRRRREHRLMQHTSHSNGGQHMHHRHTSEADASNADKTAHPVLNKTINLSIRSIDKETKKFQKPKHLKRKLTVANHDDEKIMLQQQLSLWEKTKRSRHFIIQASTTDSDSLVQQDSTLDERSNTMKNSALASSHQIQAQEDPRSSEATVTVKNESTSPTMHNVEREIESNTDDDEQENVNSSLPRQRGKRRRGRLKDATNKADDQLSIEPIQHDHRTSLSPTDTTNRDQLSKVRTRKDGKLDNRRCLGRKPITDFHVGIVHAAKVMYVKPYGVFLDIGCHSDAFCHVSRVRDDFISTPDQILHPGDIVQACIVEIERNKKRITVSLRSKDLSKAKANHSSTPN
jgi:predicted RNA-binding protein with RPS1 domain